MQAFLKKKTDKETWNHYFKVSSLCVLCCILFSTFSYCRSYGASIYQSLFHRRKSTTFYPNSWEFIVICWWTEVFIRFIWVPSNRNKDQSFKREIRYGKKGKTVQFWLSYLDMMEQQHCLHAGIWENSFETRMNAWEYLLPFYFVMNKLNYARYGSYYLYEMKNKEVPVSTQGQNWYNIRTPIDLRGE